MWTLAKPEVRALALKAARTKYQKELVNGTKKWSTRTRSVRHLRLSQELVKILTDIGLAVDVVKGQSDILYLRITK